MNQMLLLNVPSQSLLTLNTSWILQNLPISFIGKSTFKTSMLEKELYFVLANGHRSLLIKTMEINEDLQEYIEDEISTTSLYYLLILMTLGILGSAGLLVLTLRSTMKIERGK